MLLAHKVELRPTPEQATWLLKCIGARRYTYNALLEHFRKDGVKWSKHVALTSMLRRLKKVISDSGLSGFCATFHFGGHPYPMTGFPAATSVADRETRLSALALRPARGWAPAGIPDASKWHRPAPNAGHFPSHGRPSPQECCGGPEPSVCEDRDFVGMTVPWQARLVREHVREAQPSQGVTDEPLTCVRPRMPAESAHAGQ